MVLRVLVESEVLARCLCSPQAWSLFVSFRQRDGRLCSVTRPLALSVSVPGG